jgi:tetratricopeptide (TPR) repeat protein
MAHLILSQTDEAASGFRRALSIDSSHYGSLVNLAGILLAGRQHEEAIELLHRALRLKPDSSPEVIPALNNLSLAHEMGGRPMEAAQLVLRVHRLKPGHIRTDRLRRAAATLEEMGDDADAIELLSWLRDHDPSDEDLRLLAELLERRGDFQEAALIYRRLLRDDDTVAAP